MIELMISLGILNVALLAIFAAFNSGALAVARASQTSSASVLADKQMELYRAVTYSNVALETTELPGAALDTAYTGDAAWDGAATQSNKTCTGPPLPAQCDPRQDVTGPDGRSYRVHTYIYSKNVVDGRPVQQVTVVVRTLAAAKPLARLTSTFDQSTG